MSKEALDRAKPQSAQRLCLHDSLRLNVEMPKVKISGGRVFLLPSVPQEPQSHSVAQSERSSGAVLKQLIAKPSK